MAVYFVWGKLGAGKTIYCVRKMKEYAARGSRIATNFDVLPEKLTPNTSESILRIPDHPRIEDFDIMGRGAPVEEKTQLGGLFLDEMATWMNSRSWNDKSRAKLLDWFLHARKHGWDVYFMVQDPEAVDKQLLGALGEHFVECSRLDRFRIPIFSDIADFYNLVRSRGKKQTSTIVPHINKAITYYGKSKLGRQKVRTEFYKPVDFFGTYDTNQIFDNGHEVLNDHLVDMRAPFSLLPGKTLNAWSKEKPVLETPVKEKSKVKLPWGSLVLFLVFALGAYYFWPSSEEPAQVEPVQVSNSSLPAARVEHHQQSKPPYLKGVYISGYVIKKDKMTYSYDYAFHNEFDESAGLEYFGVRIFGISPCHAQVVTHDNQRIDIYCGSQRKRDREERQQEQLQNPVNDLSLTKMATETINAI